MSNCGLNVRICVTHRFRPGQGKIEEKGLFKNFTQACGWKGGRSKISKRATQIICLDKREASPEVGKKILIFLGRPSWMIPKGKNGTNSVTRGLRVRKSWISRHGRFEWLPRENKTIKITWQKAGQKIKIFYA